MCFSYHLALFRPSRPAVRSFQAAAHLSSSTMSFIKLFLPAMAVGAGVAMAQIDNGPLASLPCNVACAVNGCVANLVCTCNTDFAEVEECVVTQCSVTNSASATSLASQGIANCRFFHSERADKERSLWRTSNDHQSQQSRN
jgi:hypothetical protein